MRCFTCRGMSPRTLGERNDACLPPFVARNIAQIRGNSGCTFQEVAERTTPVLKNSSVFNYKELMVHRISLKQGFYSV